MRNSILYLLTFWILCNSLTSPAQCDFTASLSPDNLILCPQGTGELNLTITPTAYDSVKWFKWLSFGSFEAEEIPDWENSLAVDLNQFDHSGYSFFAQVYAGNCDEFSDTVLVDGYIFLPPVVMHGGSAELNQNGVWEVACGQDATLELMMPYTNSIVWYRNGVPLPDENAQVLNISQSGLYTVSGAPELCPDLISFLGLELEFVVLPDPALSISLSGNQLTANAGNAWQWFLNGVEIPGATEQVYSAITEGYYQVEASFDANCIVLSDSFQVNTTGIASSICHDLKLGPNPCHDELRIEGKESIQNSAYEIISIDGRVMAKGRLVQNALSVSALPSGFYTLRLSKVNAEPILLRFNKIN
jgi:hypothetical protein